MARDIDTAFFELLGRLTPSASETAAAASHRQSIDQCLRSNFGMTSFFRSGSFGYGTSVSGYSDVDCFAVLPANRLSADSNASLHMVADVLRRRFPQTAIRVDAPAVAVPFGQTPSEKHEIIPCFHSSTIHGHAVFGIPDREGRWMNSAPNYSGAIIDYHHQRLAQKAKPLIRLLKAWKYFANVPIRSFYLEMKVTEYLASQSSVVFKIDVRAALNYLYTSGLANIADPAGGNTPIYFGFTNQQTQALQLLGAAVHSATAAANEEAAGRVRNAFSFWDRVFQGKFPGYY